MFKKLSKAMAMLLVAMLVLPTMVFAAPVEPPTRPGGDDWNQPGWALDPDLGAVYEAAIRKVLVMPAGTAVPNLTFHFDINLIEADGNTTGDVFNEAVADIRESDPPAAYHITRSVTFNPTMTSSATPSTRGEGNTIEVYLEAEDFLNDIEWPHAGVFVFEITERRGTNPAVENDYVNYNPQDITYQLRVYIANIGPDGALGIWGIVAADFTRTIPCDDRADNLAAWLAGNTAALAAWLAADPANTEANFVPPYTHANFACDDCIDQKIDPTPGESDMIFENHFTRVRDPHIPGENPREDAPLYVEKFVTGALGDRTRYFEFNMSLQLPLLWVEEDYDGETIDIPTHVYAYIIGPNPDDISTNPYAVVVPDAENFPTGLLVDASGRIRLPLIPPGLVPLLDSDGYPVYDENDDPVMVIAGLNVEEFTFFLRHGQRLEFVQLPVGTTYVVTEPYVQHYDQSALRVEGNIPGTTIRPEEADDDLVVGGRTEQDVEVIPGVGEEDDTYVLTTLNYVEVTNDRPSVPPMGVVLDNLPFIGLIVLAVGGLVGYITLKMRAAKKNAGYAAA